MRRRAILFLMAGLFLVITVAGYLYLRESGPVIGDTRPLDAAGEKELKNLKGRAESLEKRLLGLAPKTATTYLVIDTGRNLLFMYEDGREVLKAICSTGSGRALVDPERKRRWTFDTPRGEFFIRAKHPNPVWIKPDWAFLEVGEPIPRKLAERLAPTELGAYAMDLGDGYLIHGTLYQRALGMSITHGCVRLGDKDLETVYDKVKIGTPVYIY
jgi:L,D-transpeptidase YbiS